MTPEQVREIVENALRNPLNFPWAAWVVVLLLVFAAGYYGSYAAEKGKNAATKEDIRELTETIKAVEHIFNEKMELYRGNIALRNVAALERLKAHQAGYAMWAKLLRAVYDHENRTTVVMECLNWWENNCLYLTADAREAFRSAINKASLHEEFLRSRLDAKEIMENWNGILRVATTLVEGAELPAIGEAEFAEDIVREAKEESEAKDSRQRKPKQSQ